MKKNQIVTALLFSIFFAICSCKKETPPTIDEVPPLVSLALSAENTMQNLFFRSDSLPLGKVNMKPGTKYNYIIAVFDTSGIKHTLYSLTNEYYPTFTFTSIPNPTYVDTTSSNLYYYYNDTLLGSNYTRFLITGSFTTPPVNMATPLNFTIKAYDYKSALGLLDIHCEVNSTPDEERWGWINL